jgi:hypothetical protein
VEESSEKLKVKAGYPQEMLTLMPGWLLSAAGLAAGTVQ